jgi:hypothetical protein
MQLLKQALLSPGLILRSIAKQCVSKDGAALVLRDAALRAAPQDEGGERVATSF